VPVEFVIKIKLHKSVNEEKNRKINWRDTTDMSGINAPVIILK
jgi:hypothetical protein